MKLFPPPERRGVLFWIGLVVAVLFFLTVACCGSLGLFLWTGYRDVSPVTEQFMQRWRDGEHDLMYDEASTGWRREQTRERSLAMFEGFNAALGPPKTWSLQEAKLRNSTQGTAATVVYGVSFEKARGRVTFRLAKEGTAWRVYGITVNSDALLQGLPGVAAEQADEQPAAEALPLPDADAPASP